MMRLPKTILRLLMVSVVALATMLLGSSAATAEDYPAPVFSASVNHQIVVAGQPVVFSLVANVDCNWTTEWNGETRNGSGMNSSATFTAPDVDSKTVIDGHINCDYVSGAMGGGGAAVGVKLATWTTTIPVTVLPVGQGGPAATNAGALPNTGGPSWYLLAGGLLLLVAGAGAVRASKRQPAEVEGN